MNNPSIDSVKGVAIFGVVICHIAFVNKLDHKTIEEIYSLQHIFSWCVMGFFFCSGYLEKNWENNILDWSIKKTKRLLVPLLTFELTYKILLFFSSKFGLINFDIVWSQFLFSFSAPQTYFLYVLCLLFIVLKLLIYKLRLDSDFLFLLLFLTVMLYESPNAAYGNDFLLYPYYLLCMLSGFIMKSKEESLYSKGVFACYFAIAYLVGNDVLMFVFVPIFMYISLNSISWSVFIKPLIKLGKYSSSIYIWHAPIILPFTLMVFLPFLGDDWPTVISSFVLTLIMCIVIKKITRKYTIFKIWNF